MAALVELCLEADAGIVKVMDNTCSVNPAPSYENSGIAAAARQAGAGVVYLNRGVFTILPSPTARF